jgi:hypothetical protein
VSSTRLVSKVRAQPSRLLHRAMFITIIGLPDPFGHASGFCIFQSGIPRSGNHITFSRECDCSHLAWREAFLLHCPV